MAQVAIAASAAVPPARSMSSPTWAARGWLVATIPWLAITAERLWCRIFAGRSYSPLAREGTGLLSERDALQAGTADERNRGAD